MQQSAGAPVDRSIKRDAAYSVPEVARLLDISERGTWALVASGEIPSLKLGGRRKVLGADLLARLKHLRDEQKASA